MNRLPGEIWSHIFSFDPTYRDRFNVVLSDMIRKGWAERRLLRELVRMDRSGEFVVLDRFNEWFVWIRFNGEEYTILTTGEYPFVQPDIFCHGRRLPRVDWSPACTLEALLRTHDSEKKRLKSTRC